MSDQDENRPPFIHTKGLVITLDQSFESNNWIKIVHLMRRGYSREEATVLMHRVAAGEFRNVDKVPEKQGPSGEGVAKKE